MKQFIIYIFLIVCCNFLNGQTISVTDINSNVALESVSIVDLSKLRSLLTDKNGQADISIFSSSNEIQISLIGYTSQTFTY